MLSIKINSLKEKSLLSPEFNSAKNKINTEKLILFENLDNLSDSWKSEITNQNSKNKLSFKYYWQ